MKRKIVECSIQGGSHTFSRELALVAQKTKDAFSIRRVELHGIIIGNLRPQEYFANLLHRGSQRISNFGGHALNRREIRNKLQGFLRSDTLDAFIEICADKKREIPQLLTCEPVVRQEGWRVDQLWRDGAERSFARKKFFARDC